MYSKFMALAACKQTQPFRRYPAPLLLPPLPAHHLFLAFWAMCRAVHLVLRVLMYWDHDGELRFPAILAVPLLFVILCFETAIQVSLISLAYP